MLRIFTARRRRRKSHNIALLERRLVRHAAMPFREVTCSRVKCGEPLLVLFNRAPELPRLVLKLNPAQTWLIGALGLHAHQILLHVVLARPLRKQMKQAVLGMFRLHRTRSAGVQNLVLVIRGLPRNIAVCVHDADGAVRSPQHGPGFRDRAVGVALLALLPLPLVRASPPDMPAHFSMVQLLVQPAALSRPVIVREEAVRPWPVARIGGVG
jgi:hypothetical protein